MHVRFIEHGSAEYRAACELRRRFLREPLGLELTGPDVEGEESQHHFGLFRESPGDARTLVGALIGKPGDAPGEVRLRQVVVHSDWRGRGHGRLLLEESERLLAELGFDRYVLYARDEAAPFYARHGYASTGETAVLIGLEHLRMEKRGEPLDRAEP